MATYVIWGNAWKITSPSTAGPGNRNRLFFPNCHEKRSFSINGFNFPARKRSLSTVRSDPSGSEKTVSEKTQVVESNPPSRQNRRWTGYVEKDTAGQTNIYSVEPAVYVAESAISSGSAGSSTEGAENTMAIIAGIGLISIAAASSILLQVGRKSPPQVQTVTEYSGPSLSYYINKFKAKGIVQALFAPAVESTGTSLPSSSQAPVVSSAAVLP
ncbi:unnamed protein product [Cuscuta europaea]|uniref:Uncharacterized protein n=1 Tax=Cuscuta europaea TaxID=41803 RepID=A0A9P0YN10_CUSEU|nr:unnamed protein product [Cuscuta europaea]